MAISIKNRVRRIAEKHWNNRNEKIIHCTKKEFIKIFELAYSVFASESKENKQSMSGSTSNEEK